VTEVTELTEVTEVTEVTELTEVRGVIGMEGGSEKMSLLLVMSLRYKECTVPSQIKKMNQRPYHRKLLFYAL
jgi:hypothetical protein